MFLSCRRKATPNGLDSWWQNILKLAYLPLKHKHKRLKKEGLEDDFPFLKWLADRGKCQF